VLQVAAANPGFALSALLAAFMSWPRASGARLVIRGVHVPLRLAIVSDPRQRLPLYLPDPNWADVEFFADLFQRPASSINHARTHPKDMRRAVVKLRQLGLAEGVEPHMRQTRRLGRHHADLLMRPIGIMVPVRTSFIVPLRLPVVRGSKETTPQE